MGKLAIGVALSITVITLLVIWRVLSSNDSQMLDIGSFLILSLTLIVLIWYAYDTNSIARVTRERWMREGVLGTTYSMQLLGKKEEPGQGRTLFILNNSSPLIVRAKVNCNFRVYGESAEAGAPYSGKDWWILFPHQLSQGWFEINTLLQTKGKSIAAMIAEANPQNCTHQLTMFLELEFSDELGQKRTLPGRSHYFDFERWGWIPKLTEGARI
jgi:hypothetical protein